MKRATPSSFSRYSLALDAAAFLAMSALLLAIVWVTLGELARKYLELRVADADKIELFLENRLEQVRRSFGRFADLPGADRSPALLQYFSAFSDVYVLDDELRVVEVPKSAANNRVFPGFSFSRGQVAGYLAAAGADTGFSSILRGYEDGDASVYLAVRRAQRLFVGRLDLQFLRNFLVDYSQLSGTPVLLVTREGYVIASSNPELGIHTFDPRAWEGEPSVRRSFEAGGQKWFPVVSEPRLLGGYLVTFIPAGLLDIQRRALGFFWASATVALGLFLWFKNQRLQRSLLAPLSRLAARMSDIESGRREADDPPEPVRFREFAEIEGRFRSMARAIVERERELDEASQRALEATRAKSIFLANMSHEIRTPLAGVIGMTELAQQHDEGGRLARYLGKIESSARSLLGILNQILDFSKIEAGKMTLEQTAFQPAAVAAAVAGLMDVQMPVMDGREAARRIRALDARVPLIALSASAFPEDVEKSLAAGLNEHLLKPLEMPRLDELARRHLGAGGGRDGAPPAAELSAPEGIDPALYRRWLGLFAEEFRDAVRQTREDFEAGRHESAARRLHKLSGSAGAFGAAELGVSARELQQLAKQGSLPPDRLADLETRLSAFLAACR